MKGRIIYPDDEKPWIKITSAKIIFPKTISPKPQKSSSMNIIKTTAIVAVSIIATLAVAAIMGFQISEITAEKIPATEYLTTEGVTITGDFKFREGEELVPIQVFTQTKGFVRSEPFQFSIQKVVGNTPLLTKQVDDSFLIRSSTSQKLDNDPFDVDIILATGPHEKRGFAYHKCFIKNYAVNTLRDQEEGYFNKGFAIVEDYALECKDMEMQNPSLDEMNIPTDDQKTTTSSMDLRDTSTWSSHYKSQKPDLP